MFLPHFFSPLMKKTIQSKTQNTQITEIKKTINKTEKMNQQKNKNNSSWIVKFWLIWGLFVILGYWFYQTLNLIYLIFSAIIIALATEGLILSFEKKVKKRWLAIIISYLFLFLFIFSGIIFIVPFLISQLSYLITWTSKVILNVRNFFLTNTRPEGIQAISRLPWFAKQFLLEHRNNLPRASNDFQATILSGLNTLLNASTSSLKQLSVSIVWAIGGIFTVGANILIVFTTAIFFSIEKDYLIKLFLKISNPDQKEHTRKKIDNMYEKLSLWLKARIYLSLFVIIGMYIAFWIMAFFGLKIPNIFTLSLITGLLDIVPYIGPFLSVIPVVILAFIHHGFWGMIIAGGVFLVIQWVQNNIITPILMEKQVWTNSILIIICALLWATIMGFRGIILSVPLAIIVGLFIDEQE